MKTPKEQAEFIEILIRQLKISESKMRVGQFIGAWRDIQRITSLLSKYKDELEKM